MPAPHDPLVITPDRRHRLGTRTAAVFASLALAFAVLPGSAVAAQPEQDHASPSAQAPDVWPTPQKVRPRPGDLTIPDAVGVVSGKHTDGPALRVVKQVLRRAGAQRLVQAQARGRRPHTKLTVYVGGRAAGNPATGRALHRLDVDGPAGLPEDGYVLAAGRDHGRRIVTLSGVDSAGTFYAAQTFRQLVVTHGETAKVHAVEVRDWPAMDLRGVIEGFYGQPWSHQDRLRQLDFYGRTKQNIYIYSPKDDPYLRAKWRQPYPPDQLDKIAELVDRAHANHVEFTYALSPGLSICYSSDKDLKALVDKFESMWDIGVRSFNIPLDDISYTDWNCQQDRVKFGAGGRAAGEAQSYLLNRVREKFIAPHRDEGIERLQMVPTEYYNVSDSPYKKALRENLDDRIVAQWTGIGVIAPTITEQDAKAAEQVFGHDILVWDNYPVNDYVDSRLLVGPYVGREPGIADHLVGVTANPMVQAEASKIAEFTSGAFVWNPDAYQPKKAWLAALRVVGGDAWKWLKVLAENSYSSRLQSKESLVLSPLIDEFWPAYGSGGPDASEADALADYFAKMAATPGELDAQLENEALLDEIAPWTEKLGWYGEAGGHAVRMLRAVRSGDGDTAWAQRQQVKAALKEAHAVRAPVSNVEPQIAPGVFTPFVNRALDTANQWFGVRAGGATATTSLGTYATHKPANMVDGDSGTFFWSDAPPSAGDYVGVDLGSQQAISSVDVLMSKPSSPDDYIHHAVLEVSADGESWVPVGSYTDQAEIHATLPEGTSARHVRARVTAGQTSWVVVREFTVHTADEVTLEASGGPPAAGGSSLAAAVDGYLDTAYTAARKPKTGEALTVTLGTQRRVRAVTVLQSPQQPATARIQVRTDDGWEDVGSLYGGYTKVDTGEVRADAVRLTWTSGSPAPRINEVIPGLADRN